MSCQVCLVSSLNFVSNPQFLVVFILFIRTIYVLIPPGANNPYYLIESYYGSRSKEYYSSSAILNDQPTTFQWCTNFDYDPDKGRIYFANPIKHIIQYRDVKTDEIVVVAGIEGFSGNRNGDLANTLFNGPTALKIFRYDKVKAQQERRKIMVILKSNSLRCQYATYDNYTECIDDSQEERTVDPTLIKEIYPPYDASLVTDEDNKLENLSGKILFVMDKKNNCIRKLSLDKSISETFAGTCETAGFKDGPSQVNLFNKPDSFGIDVLGNLFVLDAGNQYLRIVSQEGFTNTLLKGACNEVLNAQQTEITENLQTRSVTCYRKWIKTSGLPNSHIFQDLTSLDKCFENDVLCGGRDRSHPILYQNSTFRGSFTTSNTSNTTTSRILQGGDL